MSEKTNKYLIVALLVGVVFNGSGIFFTLENTYDALIHLFFAEHYASGWFENWSYKWYTGFTVMGYPPLVHQAIAMLSYIGGLKFGLFSVAIIAIVLFITGVYRFSLLLTGNRKVAGYSAIIAAFSSSFVETLHIFGQLPSLVGISILMHSFPEIYGWVKNGKIGYLLRAISLMAVMVTSHHVTPIFGMVFFIFPLLGMTIMDVATGKAGSIKAVSINIFIRSLFSRLKRIIIFGGLSLAIIVFCILPYWINTKNNPITQVPIPHGSRDNFLEVTSSGLVFFLIPWGAILFLLPYIFYRYYSKRYLFFGLSISLLTLLGTGGTTPLPRMLLGDNAFNILTLDRFTLWASIMALPMLGEFVYRLAEADLRTAIQNKLGAVYHRILGGIFAATFLFITVFTLTLGYFRPMQPQKIKMLPIINFLSQDQHDQWRYLTLGFGDQIAWLSAQTNAMSVDGNYHSARRLPELTTRAVERLENSKFRGIEGIGSLQQFLTVPEKYNLKFVFSNDKFYDPLLYFCGWQRLQQLENGIMVWEKLNVPPLTKILPKEDAPKPLKLIWGIVPLAAVLIAFILNIQLAWYQTLKIRINTKPDFFRFGLNYNNFSKRLVIVSHLWWALLTIVILFGLYHFYLENKAQLSPRNVLVAYYDALDFKEFQRAHSYIDPNAGKSIDQFMLEIAVTDGLLSSYAKLDAIDIQIDRQSKNKALAEVKTSWITPLLKGDQTYHHELQKRNGKWFIEPSKIDPDIPPDQLFSENTTRFYNQGRRKISTQQSSHEDILKQPVLEVLSAKLVNKNGRYSIIGEIQNIDNVPADVVIKATLYDRLNTELASYNNKDIIKHKLLPKEITSFRVDFEGIAWIKNDEEIPAVFDPDQFTPVELKSAPAKFNLQCAGNVLTKDLYKNVGISDMELKDQTMNGTLFNYGVSEVTIPELLVSYYNTQKELIWVENLYLKEGIRVQRKQHFDYALADVSAVKEINNSLENCYVNGLPNSDIARKIVSQRINLKNNDYLQPVENGFIKIELNNYVGKPN
nr:hypothetical protein [uncultured Draconibacterium sp.]